MLDRTEKPVALVDLDGTLANYDKALERDMESLQSLGEKHFKSFERDSEPPYLRERMNVIRSRSE